MTETSANQTGPERGSPTASRARYRSAIWSAFLIPFVFLPYRWLWLPCALGTTVLLAPSRHSRREVVRANETLVFGSVIVLLLRTALDPGWWAPWVVVMVAAFWFRGRTWWRARVAVPAVAMAWAAAVVILARPLAWPLATDSTQKIPSDAVLVCAGDSLTSGLSLKSDKDTYVAALRKRLPCEVINAGIANDKTGDLLARMDKDVIRRKPTVVLVFIGGNDFLDETPRSKFAAQFDALISRISAAGPKIIVVEVPTGIVWNRYAGIYRRVAARYGAILVPESKLRWWFSLELLARDHLAEPLTLDGIHLSPSGAVRVADWLEPYVRQALARP